MQDMVDGDRSKNTYGSNFARKLAFLTFFCDPALFGVVSSGLSADLKTPA
jgi:hypothetical protein